MNVVVSDWRGIGGALGLMLFGALGACGPMPGYVDPDRHVAASPSVPPAPPAPSAPPARMSEPGDDEDAGDDVDSEEADVVGDPFAIDPKPRPTSRYEAEPKPRTAPRYEPPAPRYEPPQRQTPPARYEPPTQPGPYVPPVPASPSTSGGIRKITIDDETYYLLDPARKLCFLRHRETMTAIDCSRIPEARDFVSPSEPAPAPARLPEPEPAPARAPSRVIVPPAPEPAPSKGNGPTPDEIARFEGAFVDIFCDRKGGEDVAPEDRIQDRGLAVARYEELESWWAADEKAWWNLTDKARKACPQR